MKDRKLLLWIYFLTTLTPLFAQVEISLKEQLIKVYLPQYDLIKVVDARPNGEHIGGLRTDSHSETELAFFDRPFEEAILGMIENLNNRSAKYPLILQFNEFKIYEFTYFKDEYAYVELNVEFITEIEGQHYSLFESAIIQNRAGTGVKSHSLNIRAAIKQSLAAFIMRLENNELTKIPIELGVRQTESYPIQATNFIPKGLFMSFDDFRDNIVTEVEFQSSLRRSSRGEEYNRARLKITGRNAPSKKEIWGFSDGENCFMKIGIDFHRVFWRQDTALVKFLSPEIKPFIGRNIPFFIGDTDFLLITAPLTPQAEMYAEYGGSTQNMSDNEDWQINLLTGNMMPYGSERLANVILYNSKFNDKEITFTLGEQELCKLPDNTVFWYQSKQSAHNVELCATVNDKIQCKTIVPDFNRTQVYEVKYHKKKGIEFNLLRKSARNNIIKEIKAEEMEVVLKYDEPLKEG